MRRHDIHDATGRIEYLPGRGTLQAWGAVAPTQGATGYAPGCTWQNLAATAPPFMYVNQGSFTAARWEPLGGGLAYSNAAASTAVTNTVTETTFSTSYSIPANSLRAGSVIDVDFQGIATATHSTDTLQIKLLLGSTAILTSAATNATDNDIFAGEATLVVRTIGASGTFVANGSFTSVEAASGTATRVDAILASTAVDTTAALVVGVSATWSVADPGNSCRLDILTVKIF